MRAPSGTSYSEHVHCYVLRRRRPSILTHDAPDKVVVGNCRVIFICKLSSEHCFEYKEVTTTMYCLHT